jgi:methylmalonyl-CoA mutase cobalamin-binding subunit
MVGGVIPPQDLDALTEADVAAIFAQHGDRGRGRQPV